MKLSAVLLALVVWGAAAAAQPCRLALALALDISSSVDKDERTLQLEGLALAFEDRAVHDAVLSVPGTSVAILIFEWSGQYDQLILQNWVRVATSTDLAALAAAVRNPPARQANRPTALGAALEFARRQFEAVPDCLERTVDISGDGRNNDGIPPEQLYDWRDFGGITVNALAIGHETKGLAEYFRTEVIRGPGAFVMEAVDFADYARAIREKLIREVGVPQLGALR